MNVPEQPNLFKKEYQKYRLYKDRPTDWSTLVDFSQSDAQLSTLGIERVTIDGLDKQVYKFSKPEGALLIRQALSHEQQLEIAQECLNQYVYPPYRNSLFIYDNMNTGLTEVKKMYDLDKQVVRDPQKYFFNKKIRWANVGWHYDWELRQYLQQNTCLSPLLKRLIMQYVELLRPSNLIYNLDDYNPQSTILNFYDNKDHMGGHLDDGEPDQTHPIFSFQMGLSCVFLIGSPHKTDQPLGIKLDAGDLFIMSGHARHCYHGVPRIIEHSSNYQQLQQCYEDSQGTETDQDQQLIENWQKQNGCPSVHYKGCFYNSKQHVINYLAENRINVTFRQVFID